MSEDGNGGHWAGLTDEQLLATRFTTDDPENLAGLVLDVPASAQDAPIVEFSYNFRGSKRAMIRCAHCKYPNHLAGIVIKTKDSQRFLVGHDCGEKVYGFKFEGLHRDFSEAQRRASALRRLRNLREALPAFCAWLSSLRRDPALRVYAAARHDFQTQTPRLWGVLQTAVSRSTNVLYVDEQVRNFDAETRAQGRYERELEQWNNETATERKKLRREGYGPPEPPKLPIFSIVQKAIGVIPVPTFFSADSTPAHYISVIADEFAYLNRPSVEMSDADKAKVYAYKGKHDARGSTARLYVSIGANSTREIEQLLKDCNTLLDRLDVQLGRLRDFAVFYEAPTLPLIAQWASARSIAGTYSASGTSIRLTNTDNGRDGTVTLPSGYAVPSAEPVQRMREAINRL